MYGERMWDAAILLQVADAAEASNGSKPDETLVP
jgi:hypothetical protein